NDEVARNSKGSVRKDSYLCSHLKFSSARILIPEASVAGNNHNSGFGDTEAPAVFFQVVADFDSRWDAYVFIDNHPPQFCMAADIDAVHQDAIVDLRITVDAHFRRDDRILHAPAADDRSLRDDRIDRNTDAPFVFESPD